jgi:ABC-type lipoprotein export system ATPase subunit
MSVMATAAGTLSACRGVSVAYGTGPTQVEALRRVSLRVRTRETVALTGSSGSGKTTLLHVLGGLVEPAEGIVEWEGQALSVLGARARASGIAYVFQGANLLPYFTAQDNVGFAARAGAPSAEGGWPEPIELLGLVGLAHKAQALPAELSGGERQRVAIARALAQKPRLLLCDEPTGQLDSDTAERVLRLIEAARDEFGFAVVTATHDTDLAARFERTVTLADGEVVDAGVGP